MDPQLKVIACVMLADGALHTLGLEDSQAVRLAMAPRVAAESQAWVHTSALRLTAGLIAGLIALPLEYGGTEFAFP